MVARAVEGVCPVVMSSSRTAYPPCSRSIRLRALIAAELVDYREQHGVLPGHKVDHRLAESLQHRADSRRELRQHGQVLCRTNQRAEQPFPELPQPIDPIRPVDVVHRHAHLEELARAHQQHDPVPWRQRAEARVGSVPDVLRQLAPAVGLRRIAFPIAAQARRDGFRRHPDFVGGVEVPKLEHQAEVGVMSREAGGKLEPLEQQLEECHVFSPVTGRGGGSRRPIRADAVSGREEELSSSARPGGHASRTPQTEEMSHGDWNASRRNRRDLARADRRANSSKRRDAEPCRERTD